MELNRMPAGELGRRAHLHAAHGIMPQDVQLAAVESFVDVCLHRLAHLWNAAAVPRQWDRSQSKFKSRTLEPRNCQGSERRH